MFVSMLTVFILLNVYVASEVGARLWNIVVILGYLVLELGLRPYTLWQSQVSVGSSCALFPLRWF